MSDQKVYPPGVSVPPQSSAPPAYSAGPAYPTQPGSNPAPYPTQPGSAPAYTSQPGVSAGTAAAHAQLPGGDQDQRYNAQNISKLRHIPAWPLWLAIFFYIWNCIIPGFGMWIACLCMCCGNTVVRGDSMLKMVCIQFWLGLAAIITLVFGIGYWIAILWSLGTIANSRMYYNNPIDESEIRQPSAVVVAGQNM